MRQLEAVAAQMSDVGEGTVSGTVPGTVPGNGRDLDDDAASASGSDVFSDVGSSVDVAHAGSVAVKAARVSVLKVSLGRLRWVPCAIRVDEPTNSLVLFDSKGKNVFPPTSLSGRGAGAVRFSKRAAVGQPNAIVVCYGA